MSAKNKHVIYCKVCDRSIAKRDQDLHQFDQSHIESLRKSVFLKESRETREISDLPLLQCERAPIESQIRAFTTQLILPTEKCKKTEEAVLSDLKPILIKTFGKCETYCFGSMTSGLAFVGSDAQIHVEIGDFVYDPTKLNRNHIEQSKISKCAQALYLEETFSGVTANLDAKVPTVTATHVATETRCFISFKNPLGVESSRLILYYLQLHPVILEAMLIIKYWATRHKICSGKFFVSSYGWTLMFIGYLQTLRTSSGDRFVPSLSEMQKISIPRFVDDVRVDFSPSRSFVLPDDPRLSRVMGLLEGFFEYYQKFAFEKSIVSVFVGKPVNSQVLRDVPKDSREFDACLKCVKSCKTRINHFAKIIQDPFVHDALLTCPRWSFPKVLSCLRKAAKICKDHRKSKMSVSTVLPDLFSIITKKTFKSKKPQICHGSSDSLNIAPKIETKLVVCLKRAVQSESRAVAAIKDIFRKLMICEIISFANLPLESSSVNVTNLHIFQCVPIAPSPALYVRKEVLDKCVASMSSKTDAEFKAAMEENMSRKLVLKKYETTKIREFLCIVNVQSPSLFEISLKPCAPSVQSNGFVSHLVGFLKNSLGDWLTTILSD